MARLIIAAGGTGGHVYPALAVAEALTPHGNGATGPNRHPQSEVQPVAAGEAHELVFVGTRGSGGFEKRLVDESSVEFAAYEAVYAGPIVGVNPLRAALSMGKMGIGVAQALGILRRHQPQAILMTGGWANVPLAVAAWMLRVPMLVYLPDVEPGTTIKVLSRMVQRVCITTPESAQFFSNVETVVTGYPLRTEVKEATRDEARRFVGISDRRKRLLVMGGSRGARSINLAVEAMLPELAKMNVHVSHIVGAVDWRRHLAVVEEMDDRVIDFYKSEEYLDSEMMGIELAAADLVVARAGASVLGEFPYFGLPSVLVPYPYAWHYQRVNADWLVERGAAIRINDEDLDEQLLPTLLSLLQDERRLLEMQQSARALHTSDGASAIATQLLDLAAQT